MHASCRTCQEISRRIKEESRDGIDNEVMKRQTGRMGNKIIFLREVND